MLKLSAHLGYLFSEMALERRFEAARKEGFSIVEHPGPYALPASRVAELCRANGLTVSQIALPAGDPDRGEKGLACLPGRERDFRASVETGLAYARDIGCRHVHVMAGVLPDGVARERAWSIYLENLSFVCDAAAAAGLSVLVEPIGIATIGGYFIDHPDLALRAMAEVAAPNLSMLFDAFHAANAGVDPIAFVTTHHQFIQHVHVADWPDRHEPGSGSIDFHRFFQSLTDVDFSGAVGLEYIPKTTASAGLGWRAAYGLG